MPGLRVRSRCLAAEIACLFPWDSSRDIVHDNPSVAEPFPQDTILDVRSGKEPAPNTDTEENRNGQELARAKRSLLQSCRTAGLMENGTHPLFMQTEDKLIKLAKEGHGDGMQAVLDDAAIQMVKGDVDNVSRRSSDSDRSSWSGEHCPHCGTSLPSKKM